MYKGRPLVQTIMILTCLLYCSLSLYFWRVPVQNIVHFYLDHTFLCGSHFGVERFQLLVAALQSSVTVILLFYLLMYIIMYANELLKTHRSSYGFR